MDGQVESEEQSGERKTETETERRARGRKGGTLTALRFLHYALFYGHQSFHQGFLFLRTALSGEFPVIVAAASLKYFIAESAYE